MPIQDPTTNYGWDLPAVGGDADAWGTKLNTIFGDDATGIDAVVKAISDVANGGKMTVGTKAARPAEPTHVGESYYASDTKELYIGVAGTPKTWVALIEEGTARITVDTAANRPASPELEGQMFYASDTGALSVGSGGAWVVVTDGSLPFRARVWRDSNLTLAATTPTIVGFNQESFDSSSIHDNATNNSRLTVPAGISGTIPVIVQTHITFSAVGDPAGRREVRIKKNGGATPIARIACDVDAEDEQGVMLSVVDEAVSGDYYEVEVESAPGAVDVQGGIDARWNSFQIAQLK